MALSNDASPLKGRSIIASVHSNRPAALLAGQSDSAAHAVGQPRKALLPIRGRPMPSYVVKALYIPGCMEQLMVLFTGIDISLLSPEAVCDFAIYCKTMDVGRVAAEEAT
jgi:hypothetical protein